MIGKRWKGGVEGFERDMARGLESSRRSLAELLEPGVEIVNPILYEGALSSSRFILGLKEWWFGNEATARELFSEAAKAAEAFLARRRSRSSPGADSAELAQHGAIAASLSGQPELARELFAQAELLATACVTNDATPPDSYLEALDHPSAIRPYIRAYCLIRLGRLSGVNAFIYTVQLEQAREATPIWKSADIHELLDTAHLCHEMWRAERREDYVKEKKLAPLLRALVACLSPGAGEPERLAARKALQAYQDAIHDLYYFNEIYPRVLDLRAAYPHIFG
jgi:hypothetical protein